MTILLILWLFGNDLFGDPDFLVALRLDCWVLMSLISSTFGERYFCI